MGEFTVAPLVDHGKLLGSSEFEARAMLELHWTLLPNRNSSCRALPLARLSVEGLFAFESYAPVQEPQCLRHVNRPVQFLH